MKATRIESIKRRKQITLRVNGKEEVAFEGETVLAALLVAGHFSLKKNPVSHEPRGAVCGMGVCFECSVTINGIPNMRSCMTEVADNMEIEIDE